MQDRKHSELEKKMSRKYHMVKFFERKKIKKGIRQVERKLEEVSPCPVVSYARVEECTF